MQPEIIDQKIMLREHAKSIISLWQFKNEKIVFTNGCFDILHRGHLEYLLQAAALGHRLVIGLNSDDSVSRLKGPSRPVNKIDDRAFALASLRCTDLIVPFEEDTPLELIEFLQPNILVKGGDYDALETDPASKRYIVGSFETKSRGGNVVCIPIVAGYSTTNAVNKIKKSTD
jgi:rfaE bifunctional protein nucleotidyltransferase chain/domain